MRKVLQLHSAYNFVTAVSGIFVTPGNPTGLTVKERKIVALFLMITDGMPINPRKSKDTWKTFKNASGFNTQAMSNMMTTLRKKNVFSLESGYYSLHPILRKNQDLVIKYE